MQVLLKVHQELQGLFSLIQNRLKKVLKSTIRCKMLLVVEHDELLDPGMYGLDPTLMIVLKYLKALLIRNMEPTPSHLLSFSPRRRW